MKLFYYLFVVLLFPGFFSCTKKQGKPEVEASPSVETTLPKYTGTYSCLLESKTFFSAPGTDTSYFTLVDVKKSETPGNLIFTTPSSGTVEVTLYNTDHFSGARFLGFFFGKDSLYIDNSHPSGIYSNQYHGKKIKD